MERSIKLRNSIIKKLEGTIPEELDLDNFLLDKLLAIKLEESQKIKDNIFEVICRQKYVFNNYCNFYSFLTFTTPILFNGSSVSVSEFFKCFEEASFFGVTCTLKDKGKCCQINYSPTLSSLFLEKKQESNGIFFSQNSLFNSFNSATNSKKKYNFNEQLNHLSQLGFLGFPGEVQSQQPSLSFHECVPLYRRLAMSETVQQVLKEDKSFDNVKICDLGKNSYLSILWTPSKSEFSHHKNNASFLVFYSFQIPNCTLLPEEEAARSLKVIGVLSSEIGNEAFWFDNQFPIFESENRLEMFHKLSKDYFNNKSNFDSQMVAA